MAGNAAMTCLDENILVSFSQGTLSPAAVSQVLSHLADCERCSGLVSMLASSEPEPDVPALQPVGAPAAAAAEQLPERYRIEHPIGMGAMGVVYAAHDRLLDRQVAIKMLRAIDRDTLQAAAASVRFVQEAKTLARLAHPHVVRIYDAGWLESRFFIAMELVQGQPMRAWLAEHHPSWKKIGQLYLQAAQGLAAAHAAGVIHRDFKPDNVMIGFDGQVRVTDFGLAALLGEAPAAARTPADPAPAAQRPAVIAGTRAYLAPERLAGREADARSDQYSLCMALCEALTKTLPTSPDDALERARQHVPRRLRAIVGRGLSRDPAARFASMDVFASELARALAARPRRWLALAAATTTLAAVGAVFIGGRWSELRACQAAATEAQELWSRSRSAVQDRFVASDLPFAPAMWQSIDRALTRYAGQWGSDRQKLCPRSVLGAAAPAASLRAHCMDRRKAELAALVEVLAQADASVVRDAMQAAQNLTPPQRCAELENLGSTAAWAIAPGTETTVLRLQDRAARIKALLDTGQADQAWSAAAPLVDDSKLAGYAPLLAETLYLAGSSALAAGKYAAAESLLWQALGVAETIDHDDIRLRSLLKLADLASNIRRDARGAQAYARLAEAMAGRVNIGHDVRAELAGLLAQLALYQGHPRSALGHAESALGLAESAFGPGAPAVWWNQSLLAWILKDLGQLDRALELGTRSLDLRRSALGKGHIEEAKGLYNLAAIRIDRAEFGDAIAELAEAVAISREAVGPEHLLTLRFRAAQAEALGRSGRDREASSELAAVVPIMERVAGADNARVGETLVVQGRSLMALGDLDAAAQALARGRRILEATGSTDHPWLANALVDEGECALRLGAPEQAMALAKRALALLEKAEGGYSADAAHAHFLLARALATEAASCGEAPEQARTARGLLAALGDFRAAEVARIDAWLGALKCSRR